MLEQLRPWVQHALIVTDPNSTRETVLEDIRQLVAKKHIDARDFDKVRALNDLPVHLAPDSADDATMAAIEGQVSRIAATTNEGVTMDDLLRMKLIEQLPKPTQPRFHHAEYEHVASFTSLADERKLPGRDRWRPDGDLDARRAMDELRRRIYRHVITADPHRTPATVLALVREKVTKRTITDEDFRVLDVIRQLPAHHAPSSADDETSAVIEGQIARIAAQDGDGVTLGDLVRLKFIQQLPESTRPRPGDGTYSFLSLDDPKWSTEPNREVRVALQHLHLWAVVHAEAGLSSIASRLHAGDPVHRDTMAMLHLSGRAGDVGLTPLDVAAGALRSVQHPSKYAKHTDRDMVPVALDQLQRVELRTPAATSLAAEASRLITESATAGKVLDYGLLGRAQSKLHMAGILERAHADTQRAGASMQAAAAHDPTGTFATDGTVLTW